MTHILQKRHYMSIGQRTCLSTGQQEAYICPNQPLFITLTVEA